MLRRVEEDAVLVISTTHGWTVDGVILIVEWLRLMLMLMLMTLTRYSLPCNLLPCFDIYGFNNPIFELLYMITCYLFVHLVSDSNVCGHRRSAGQALMSVTIYVRADLM